MDIAEALRGAMVDSNVNDLEVAIMAGSSQASVVGWIKGKSNPNAITYQRLRDKLPGFAARIDAQNAALLATG